MRLRAKVTYLRRYLIRFGTEREVARVGHMDFRVRHIAKVALRLANIERGIVLAPED